jgi:RNA recognition motif-containing protein
MAVPQSIHSLDPALVRRAWPLLRRRGADTVTRLFVGNLAPATRSEDLRALFATYGPVSAANVVMDRASGESRGFGFVELRVASHAVAALRGLNGSELMGRSIVVGRAHSRGEVGSRGDASPGWTVVGAGRNRW